MIEKKNVKKLAWVAVALVIMVLSMTVVSKAASNPENHKKTIEALDEKKADILKLTATSAAASTAIAAIPGDATTPIANKLTDLTSYFLIILVVIFLEKYLVTLTGYATFSILIPAACVLFAAGIGFNRTVLKILAAKIAAFGLVIFMIIPFSMNVSAMIEKTYESTMEETVKEAQDITNEIEKNTDSEGNIIEKALSKINKKDRRKACPFRFHSNMEAAIIRNAERKESPCMPYLAIEATSAAKSSTFFSMPSPFSKRTYLTSLISPPRVLATSAMCFSTETLFSLTKACCRRQFSS